MERIPRGVRLIIGLLAVSLLAAAIDTIPVWRTKPWRGPSSQPVNKRAFTSQTEVDRPEI